MRTALDRRVRAGYREWLGLIVMLASVAVPGALARPPLEPLPAPVYSLDANSPFVVSALAAAGDGLLVGPNNPIVVIPYTTLGASSLVDDMDGLSAANAFVGFGETFALLFSVDRETVGVAEVDQVLLASGIPFNVTDQAWRGQAAGDQFMSTHLFTRDGPWLGTRGVSNSALIRNNFDEGGTDFACQPQTSAQDNVSGARGSRVPQDNVDAAAVLERPDPNGPYVSVYFTLKAGSPSLPLLPGGSSPSGATVFFNPQPGIAQTVLYASAYDLNLLPADDIDALLVFDTNLNGLYDGADQVIFSLTPGSPSLSLITGTSQFGPGADLFTASPGLPVRLFAPGSLLGLGAGPDNIDALDLLPCTDSFMCAVLHGIRSFPGDVNCDHHITYGDINPFVVALGGRSGYRALYPDCNWFNADCNGDGIVNYGDINPFVVLLSTTPP